MDEKTSDLNLLCASMSGIEIATAKKRKARQNTVRAKREKERLRFSKRARKTGPKQSYVPEKSQAVTQLLQQPEHSEEYIFRKYGLYDVLNDNISQVEWIAHDCNCTIRLEKLPYSNANSSNKTVYNFSRDDFIVTVEDGDITELDVDLIVNTTGKGFSVSGPLSKAVLSKGGPGLRAHCGKLQSSVVQSPTITEAGQLPCRKVMHVQVPSTKNSMDGLITDILTIAEENMATVLALPALGTGGGGWKCCDVASDIYKGITSFLTTRTSTEKLKTVRIVLLPSMPTPDKMEFHAAFGNFRTLHDHDVKPKFPGRKILKAHRKAKKGFGTELPPSSAERSDCFKTSEELISKNHTGQHSDGNSDANSDGSFKILFTSTSPENILKAKQQIEKFVDLHLKKFTLVDDAVAALSQKQATKLKKIGFEKGVGVEIYASTNEVIVQGKVEPVFSAMDNIRKLLHSIPKERKMPSWWKQMDPAQIVLRVTLDPGSTEYEQVEKLFQDTNSLSIKFRITRVERIQNPALYGQYTQNKDYLSKNAKNKVIERRLFHGTTGDAVTNICRDGFNRSYAGKNATKLGKGVYFSTNSSVSHCYGKKQIFLAAVLTGDFCSGHGMMVDPPVNPETGRKYDSAVDSTRTPSIFVVFRDAHAYPAYIITYGTV